MNLQRLVCTLVMITTMIFAGCGGSGGGGGSSMSPMDQMGGGGSMPDNDMMAGGGPSLGACAIGPIAGNGCAHEGGGSSFTFTINDDGTACVGGICSRNTISINNFTARKNADGTWEITALPGVDPMAGGGGTTTPDNDSTTMTQDMAAVAAQNTPNLGSVTEPSVTQSSNAVNGMTTDSVSTVVGYDNGQISSTVRNGSEWSISDSDSVLARPSGELNGVSFNGIELYKRLAGGELWADVYSTIEEPTTTTKLGVPQDVQVGDVIVGLGCIGATCPPETLEGTLNGVTGTFSCSSGCGVGFRTVGPGQQEVTDVQGLRFAPESTTQRVTDPDYLNLGVWVYVPNGTAEPTEWEYGVFADGSDPFNDTNMRGVTGSATYRGAATGVAVDATEPEELYWSADATLVAEFGTSSELGTISGNVRNFVTDESSPLPNAPSVMLDSAPIGSLNNGYFTGNVSFAGHNNVGKWGGRFFGNDEPDGKPGSVAGTFGLTDGDGVSLLGAFGADKQ